MRIISKFYDYYDCIQKYGIDKTVIYKRETEEIEEIPKYIEEKYRYMGNVFHINRNYSAYCFAIILLDKCYFGLSISEYDSANPYKNKEHYFYTEDSFNKYLSDNNIVCKSRSIPIYSINIDLDFSIKHRSPIFAFYYVGREYKLVKDPFLKKFQFFKVMDEQTIYQKIQQFISGVLSEPEKEPWPISDTLKAESHGFDKWSFRKMSKNGDK